MVRQTKKQLIQLSKDKGLPFKGLTRDELMDQLQENQSNDGDDRSERDRDEELDDGQDATEEVVEVGNAETANLRLKLELARSEERKAESEERRARLEKERVEMELAAQGNAGARARGIGDGRVEQLETDKNLDRYSKRLPAMGQNEDLLAYFLTFEKIAKINNVPDDMWPNLLPPLLNATTRTHYSRLSYEICCSYDRTKNALMTACRLTPQAYLKKFRSGHRSGDESFLQFCERLRDIQSYYYQAANITDFDSLREADLLEQFLTSLPDDVRKFVDERQPKNVRNAGELADLHWECQRKTGNSQKAEPSSKPAYTGNRKSDWRKNQHHAQSEKSNDQSSDVTAVSNSKETNVKTAASTTNAGSLANVRCFQCQELGHKASYHRKNASAMQAGTQGGDSEKNDYDMILDYQKQFIIPCFVNDVSVKAIRDSGANISIVNERFVKPDQFLDNTSVLVKGVFDQRQPLRMARIVLHVPTLGQSTVQFNVAVVREIEAADILIGNDLFATFPDMTDILREKDKARDALINSDKSEIIINPTIDALGMNESLLNIDAGAGCGKTGAQVGSISSAMITTRRKDYTPGSKNEIIGKRTVERPRSVDEGIFDRQRADTSVEMTANLNESPAEEIKVSSVGETVDRQRADTSAMAGSEKSPVEGVDKVIKSTTNGLITETNRSSPGVKRDELGSINEQAKIIDVISFRKEQESDTSLNEIWRMARAGHASYFISKQLLFYRSNLGGLDTDESDHALVVPRSLRDKILFLGHSHLYGGHLGISKTRWRIRKHFYWPGVNEDISNYIKSCPECQLTANVNINDRAKLVKVPVIDGIFKVWTMDLCGPFPTTKTGKKYLLVLVDHASGWPEVFTLSSMRSDKICEKLIELFSRTGVPTELRSDRGASFMSEIVMGLERMMGCQPIGHSAYHHESSGNTEKMIGTLKSMLKKFISDEPKRWESMLNYLLFAYREVPQCSSGISPYYMVYGHEPRGVLNVLKDAWSKEDPAYPTKHNIVEYLLETRAKLEDCAARAHASLELAKDKAKNWYDQHSSDRSFKTGDKVLVLLPTSTDKLTCKWQGPGDILRRVNDVTYEVNINRRISKLHVNLLRAWHEREFIQNLPQVNVTMIADPYQEEYELLPGLDDDENNENGPEIGCCLSIQQRADLSHLISSYADVFSEKLGKTDLIQHVIKLTDKTPCVSRSYRIPDSLKDQVASEIDKMHRNGVIEKSSSSYRSPLVVVKKKDGKSIRCVADLRLVNSVTEMDQYPAPDPVQILDRCASSKFISVIDLNNAFWQVDLEKESRPYTAFEFGDNLWQYTVMPMGSRCASKTFQRLANKVLEGAEDHAAAHIDDIVVYSPTWETHLEHLRDLCERLRSAGLTAKLAKSQFAKPNIRILGHLVEGGVGTRPDPEKVQAIIDYPTPKTKKQVRAWLGISNFFRKYIKNYSEKAFVLTELTKKSSPDRVKWGPAEENAFRQLKADLCSEPCLIPPNPNKPYELHTDASASAIGSVLLQKDDMANLRPLAYFSRKLLPRERLYSVVERECLSIINSLTHFEAYVYGNQVHIKTDHHCLQWLKSFANNNPRLMRWTMILARFEAMISYVAGTQNTDADGLSRAYMDESENEALKN